LVWGLPIQRLDERAVGPSAVSASGDGVSEDSFHRSEIRDLGLHIFQVCTGHGPDLSTGALALIGEFEELPDLVDGEAERAGPPDEGEPL